MKKEQSSNSSTGCVTPVTEISDRQPRKKRQIDGLVLPDGYAVPMLGALYRQERYVRILRKDKNGKIRWKSLHRDVWEWAYGPIPTGYVVHHVDGNSLNNRLENLECLPRSEHSRLHAEHPELASPEGAAFYLKHRELSRKSCRAYHQRRKQCSGILASGQATDKAD